MARDLKDITGRALKRRTHDAMGRALFHGKSKSKPKKHKQGYKAREDESQGKWGKRPNQKINKKHGGHVSSRTKHIMDEKDEIRRVDREIRRNEGYKKGGKVKK